MLTLALFFIILGVSAAVLTPYTTRWLWGSVFVSWVLYFLLLIFYNPQHQQSILDISSARVSYHVNWGSTVVNQFSEVITITNISSLQTFLRSTTGGVRPAGSMHSFSPLVSSLGSEYVIDIRALDQVVFYNGSHIRVQAGAVIEKIQEYLALHGKTFRGIGSYTGQTLAGGFSTSLAGIEMVSFSEFVTWAKTVNAMGDIVEWNDLYYLKDSMGMMGIIIELEFQVFDNYYLEPTIHDLTIDNLMSTAFNGNFDAFDSIMTPYYDESTNILSVSYKKTSDATRVLDAPVKMNNALLNLNDYFISPLSFIIPFRNFVPIMETSIINYNEQLATIARDTHAFGLVFLDYRIPRVHCKDFLSHVLENPQDAIVRVKVLNHREDACLAYKGQTCKIEMYVPSHRDIKTYEKIAWGYGGYSHWGKYFRGDVTDQFQQFSCWPEFERRRKLEDPTDRFLNSFLRGEDYTYWHGGHRIWIYYVVFILIFGLQPIWCCYSCVTNIKKRRSHMKHLSNEQNIDSESRYLLNYGA
jgi:hypothetical protein